jgi:hypothetical protein
MRTRTRSTEAKGTRTEGAPSSTKQHQAAASSKQQASSCLPIKLMKEPPALDGVALSNSPQPYEHRQQEIV